MSINELLGKIRSGERVTFQDTLAAISEHYHYTPTRFTNGVGDDRVSNQAGTNEGSCKIFFFAKLQGLTPDQTLALFGDYYWDDVLARPEGSGHANIRTFMKYGWEGIRYEGDALRPVQP
jgi:hypothetical protein